MRKWTWIVVKWTWIIVAWFSYSFSSLLKYAGMALPLVPAVKVFLILSAFQCLTFLLVFKISAVIPASDSGPYQAECREERQSPESDQPASAPLHLCDPPLNILDFQSPLQGGKPVSHPKDAWWGLIEIRCSNHQELNSKHFPWGFQKRRQQCPSSKWGEGKLEHGLHRARVWVRLPHRRVSTVALTRRRQLSLGPRPGWEQGSLSEWWEENCLFWEWKNIFQWVMKWVHVCRHFFRAHCPPLCVQTLQTPVGPRSRQLCLTAGPFLSNLFPTHQRWRKTNIRNSLGSGRPSALVTSLACQHTHLTRNPLTMLLG